MTQIQVMAYNQKTLHNNIILPIIIWLSIVDCFHRGKDNEFFLGGVLAGGLGGGFAGSYEIHCDTVASDTLL